jgi:hypothetical protein
VKRLGDNPTIVEFVTVHQGQVRIGARHDLTKGVT